MALRPSGSLVGPAEKEFPLSGGFFFCIVPEQLCLACPKMAPDVISRDCHFEDPDAFRRGPGHRLVGIGPRLHTSACGLRPSADKSCCVGVNPLRKHTGLATSANPDVFSESPPAKLDLLGRAGRLLWRELIQQCKNRPSRAVWHRSHRRHVAVFPDFRLGKKPKSAVEPIVRQAYKQAGTAPDVILSPDVSQSGGRI